MKEQFNDGGPAFPNRGDNTPTNPIYDGMSLRDWFAGQALASRGMYGANVREKEVAEECYRIADAMIAELEKGETK